VYSSVVWIRSVAFFHLGRLKLPIKEQTPFFPSFPLCHHHSTSIYVNLTFLVTYRSGRFSTTSPRFIHAVACDRTSFVRLGSIHCVYVPHFVFSFFCWCALSSSTFWLLCIIPLWTWVCLYLSETLLSVLLDVFLEVRLLGHMIVLFLILSATSILLSIADALFYNSATVPEYSNFHFLANSCYFLFIL
jgi:hypothetical protein